MHFVKHLRGPVPLVSLPHVCPADPSNGWPLLAQYSAWVCRGAWWLPGHHIPGQSSSKRTLLPAPKGLSQPIKISCGCSRLNENERALQVEKTDTVCSTFELPEVPSNCHLRYKRRSFVSAMEGNGWVFSYRVSPVGELTPVNYLPARLSRVRL